MKVSKLNLRTKLLISYPKHHQQISTHSWKTLNIAQQFRKEMVKIYFGLLKNPGEILNKLPHNLIKEKRINVSKHFTEKANFIWLVVLDCIDYWSLHPYLLCNDKTPFFTSEQPKRYKLWSCQKICDTLHYLLANIFIRFGSKLYRQIVDIPMGTNCAPLFADLFLFCYERDFMLSLSDNNQNWYYWSFLLHLKIFRLLI